MHPKNLFIYGYTFIYSSLIYLLLLICPSIY